jgi:hypothetical protein
MQKCYLLKTVPEIRAGGMKESSGVGKFKYDTFDVVGTFTNTLMNISPPSTTIIKIILMGGIGF